MYQSFAVLLSLIFVNLTVFASPSTSLNYDDLGGQIRSPRPVVLTMSRRQAVTPPQLPKYPETAQWGANAGNYFGNGNPAARWPVFNGKGIGWVRYAVPWDQVAPNKPSGDDDYIWKFVDQDIVNMQKAGLNVYLNAGSAPGWAIEGRPNGVDKWPSYTGLDCMTQTPPYIFIGDTPNGLRDHPWCGEYKPIVQEWTNFLKALVRRYSNPPFNIKYFGQWNEPNYDIFWHYHDNTFPPITDEGWPMSPNLSIVKEILVPGYGAIKEANPSVFVVGPEVDGSLFLKWVLQEEAKQGPIADVITFQAYGDNVFDPEKYDPNPVFEKLGPPDQSGGYGSVIRQFGNGRPVWLTETNPGKNASTNFYPRLNAYPWLTKIFIFTGDDVSWDSPPN